MMIFSRLVRGENDKSVGEAGEDVAAKFLRKKKYRIIERNWYNKKGKRLGEIDIICEKSGMVVFVEVKAREISGDADVIPEEQITPLKLQKLQRAAECYIKENNLWERNWRFDAVSVYFCEGKMRDIKHIENIFF